MLEMPPTIRLPRQDEIPNNPEVLERLRDRERANIVEGYRLNDNATHNPTFTFYAEINVNNSRLWDLFKALANQLNNSLAFIYNLYEEEAVVSAYEDRDVILKQLDNYQTELVQDCNLEFGLMCQTDDRIEEVFVSESKFLRVWGNDEVAFRGVMDDFGLSEIQDINFIDEFPKVVEPLVTLNKEARSTEAIIEAFNDFFNPQQNG